MLSIVFGTVHVTACAMFWGQEKGADTAGGMLFIAFVSAGCVVPVAMISSQLFKRAAKETEEDEKQELLESEGRKSTSLELQTLGTSVDVVAPVPSSSTPFVTIVKSNDETHGTVAESAILSDSHPAGQAVSREGEVEKEPGPAHSAHTALADVDVDSDPRTGRTMPEQKKRSRRSRWRWTAFLFNRAFARIRIRTCTAALCLARALASLGSHRQR